MFDIYYTKLTLEIGINEICGHKNDLCKLRLRAFA